MDNLCSRNIARYHKLKSHFKWISLFYNDNTLRSLLHFNLIFTPDILFLDTVFSFSSSQALLEAQFLDRVVLLKCGQSFDDLLPLFHRSAVFLCQAEEVVCSISDVIFCDIILDIIRVASQGDSQCSCCEVIFREIAR